MNAPLSLPSEFPVNALPKIIRDAVLEVQANVKAPLALVASSALGAVSLACQNSIEVCRMSDLKSPCSLFLLTIAESGERKTSVDALFTKPIRSFEEEQAEKHQQAMITYEAERLAWAAVQKGILSVIKKKTIRGEATDHDVQRLTEHSAKEPRRPKLVKLIYGDATPEGIKLGLCKNGPSAGIMSDEAGSIFNGRALNDLGFVNTLWDGVSTSVDRSSKESFVVNNPRLTMSLMIQEGGLRKYIDRRGSEARDIGFLARFLVAYPLSTQGTRFIQHPIMSWEYLPKFQECIANNLQKSIRDNGQASSERVCLSFSPDAQERWLRAYNAIESRVTPGGPLSNIKDYAAKVADNLARMAALFHYFEGNQGDITFEAVDCAAEICSWYVSEFLRLFAPQPQIPQYQVDANQLECWLVNMAQSSGMVTLKKNYIRQYGPNALRNKTRLEFALNALAANNRILFGMAGKTLYVNLNTTYYNPQNNYMPIR